MPRGVPKSGKRAPRGSKKPDGTLKKNALRRKLKEQGVKVGRIARKITYDSLTEVKDRCEVKGIKVKRFVGYELVCGLGTIHMVGEEFFINGKSHDMAAMAALLK